MGSRSTKADWTILAVWRAWAEGPATLLQSCTGCLKSLEILQSFSLEKVNFSVNYVILSVICFVKRFRKLLHKFTAFLTKTSVLHDLKAYNPRYNLPLQYYNLRKFHKIVQSCTGFLGVAGPLAWVPGS